MKQSTGSSNHTVVLLVDFYLLGWQIFRVSVDCEFCEKIIQD